MKTAIKRVLGQFGFAIHRVNAFASGPPPYPVEATEAEKQLLDLAGRYSMTGPVRMWSLLQSMKHIKARRLEGDLVECGVWRGGNLILMRKVANEFFPEKTVYGFDTFDGMNPPTDADVDFGGTRAAEEMRRSPKDEGLLNIHAYAGLDTVRRNLEACSVSENVRLVQGVVEETLLLEENLPKSIALLRLDTDWYESTRIELEVLYPRLVRGGILIVDDYGHFKGAQKAVDEYFASQDVWLHYVDYTCRLLIKE